MTTPTVVPMDHDTAERIATMAGKPGARMMVGPRVLAGLLSRITELELARALLRRELDQLAARALEDARLRAHAMRSGQRAVVAPVDVSAVVAAVIAEQGGADR